MPFTSNYAFLCRSWLSSRPFSYKNRLTAEREQMRLHSRRRSRCYPGNNGLKTQLATKIQESLKTFEMRRAGLSGNQRIDLPEAFKRTAITSWICIVFNVVSASVASLKQGNRSDKWFLSQYWDGFFSSASTIHRGSLFKFQSDVVACRSLLASWHFSIN